MKNTKMYRPLYEADPQIAAAIDNETRRQHEGLELIASENFVSEAVLEAAGSQANMEAYAAVLQPGDTILGLNLAHGGHLTHGHHLNFSGKTYKIVPYGVTRESETIDYDELEKLAEKERPKLIIGGGSAYP